MSSRSGDGPRSAEAVLAVIRAMKSAERIRLFKAMELDEDLAEETGYLVVEGEDIDSMMEQIRILLKLGADAFTVIGRLGDYQLGRNRKPDQTRLDRGKVLQKVKRDKKLSWSGLASYVLTNHADWVPEYAGQQPDKAERTRIGNMLRHWVRDYMATEKDQP